MDILELTHIAQQQRKVFLAWLDRYNLSTGITRGEVSC
jgi:hypothetical protein